MSDEKRSMAFEAGRALSLGEAIVEALGDGMVGSDMRATP
jgi:hypothetical protein